jgi:hypothetical protein
MRLSLALLAALALLTPVRANFLVVANLGPKPVSFTITHPNADGAGKQEYTLRSLENRAVPAGREPEIAFTLDGKPTRYRLDPYASYVFGEVQGKPVFQGVELAGKLPPPKDVPVNPPARAPFKIPVSLYVDHLEPRNRATWEKSLGGRVAAVSALLEGQTRLKFDGVAAGEWHADSRDDLFAAMREFEKEAKAPPGGLAFGFLSRDTGPKKDKEEKAETLLSAGRGPFGTHLVFADRPGVSEAERQEVMLQELGLWLGAAHTKDPFSVMRRELRDGAATRAGFFLQFDPVNLVIVNIWAKYRRDGQPKTWADFSEPDRARLEALYKTLAQICPDSPIAADHRATLERLREKGEVVVEPGAMPVKPRVVTPVTPLAPPAEAKPAAPAPAEAARVVVAAVRARAKAIHEMPVGQRPRGDRLTEDLVRTAAKAALSLDEPRRRTGFVAALGVALDDSTTLRNNPLTRDFCKAAETDAERAERVAALGTPTLGGRRDLCQHFALSATLAELYGATAAEATGLTKELADMQGTSGFSFVDLSADLAGIALATRLKAEPGMLADLAKLFRPEDYVPDPTGLREGLSPKRFAADYGGIADPRFKAALADLRQRVAACRGLREAK